ISISSESVIHFKANITPPAAPRCRHRTQSSFVCERLRANCRAEINSPPSYRLVVNFSIIVFSSVQTMPKRSRKRSRSSSPSTVGEKFLKIVKRLEKRLDKMEEKRPRRWHHGSSSGTSNSEDGSDSHSYDRRSYSGSEADGGSDIGEKEALGHEVELPETKGPSIQQDVADRWKTVIKKGLEDEKRRDIMKKYPPPENAHNFGAPKLNAVVKQAIVDSVAKRDSRLSCQQAQVGSGLSAIAIVISDLLKTEGGNTELIEKLSDAGRLLSDVPHTLSVSRKELAILNLNKEWKETLIDSPVDEWLFGEDLEERLKAAKSLQFSSKQLKIVKAPQPKKTISKNTLNYRIPSSYQRGAKLGGRYRQDPSNHNPSNPGSSKQYNSRYNRQGEYPRLGQYKNAKKYRKY
ncbi:unnamed protein product, partial [Acanthoscelides obtectus]